MEVKRLADLVDGKVVSCSQRYIIVSKEGQQFKVEFDTHKIVEMKIM
jgi:hypothetical protein